MSSIATLSALMWNIKPKKDGQNGRVSHQGLAAGAASRGIHKRRIVPTTPTYRSLESYFERAYAEPQFEETDRSTEPQQVKRSRPNLEPLVVVHCDSASCASREAKIVGISIETSSTTPAVSPRARLSSTPSRLLPRKPSPLANTLSDTADVLSYARKEVQSPCIAMDLISDFEFGFPTTLDFVNPPPEWSLVNPAYYERQQEAEQQNAMQQQHSPLPNPGPYEEPEQNNTGLDLNEIPLQDIFQEDISDLNNYLFSAPSTSLPVEEDPFKTYFPDFQPLPMGDANGQLDRSPTFMDTPCDLDFYDNTSPEASVTPPATSGRGGARKPRHAVPRDESPSYRERRDKNNEASKMSRKRRQERFQHMKEEAVLLERKNLQLRTTLEGLEREVRDYKELLTKVMAQ